MIKREFFLTPAVILLIVVLLFTTVSNPLILAKTFAGPSTITIDGAFADWGTTSTPSSGVYFHQDSTNTGVTDGSGFAATAADLNYLWNAFSTQSGGNTPAGPGNLIQNMYYRIDTFTTSLIEPGQLYNIQLNLGVAPAGKADHLLQIWVRNSSTPKVTIVMYSYNTPYPSIGAFTSGSVIGRVSNVASPYPGYSGAIDANATGAYGKYNVSHYGIEVKIPISWFGSAYGGLVTSDGTGSRTFYGVVFTSTGTLGAVGTIKDTIGDSNGNPLYFIVDPVTGDTYIDNYKLVNVVATKTDSIFTDVLPSGASPGDVLLYTVIITNRGPNTAKGVTFQDTITDPYLTWIGNVTTTAGTITSGNAPGDNGCAVTIGNMLVDASVTITFRVQINSPLPSDVARVTNQGLVRGSNFTSVPTDDPRTSLANDATGTAVSPTDMIEPYKSWALTIDADHNGMPSPGDTLTYTVEIENIGNHDVSGVVFSDIPDAHSPLVSGSVTTNSGSVIEGNGPGDNAVTVNLGTIPGFYGSATITYEVTINNPLPFGVTQLTNQGFVFGPSIAADPTDDPTDQSYDNATVVQLTAEPLIEAYKRYELSEDADNNGLVNPGDNLTYFITIANKGNQNATGVSFSDTVDSNTSLIPGSTITSQGSVTSETLSGLTVDIGTIPGGNYTVTISFKVTIKAGATGGVYNQGTVTVSGYPDVLTDDPNTHTLQDATFTSIALGPPELRVTKSAILAMDADNNNVASPGDTLQYIVAINNNGGSAAYNLTFTDTLDPNTTLIPGSTTASLPATISETPFIQVDIGTLEAGSAHSICLVTFEATINDPFPVNIDTVANQGSVTADGIGPIPTDDSNTTASPDATITAVFANPLITATKIDSVATDVLPTGSSPGDELLYTITIINSGTTTARSVIFQDLITDPYLTLSLNSVTTTQGVVIKGMNPADNAVEVNVGDVAVGPSVSITFKASITIPLPLDVSRVTNQGLVSGSNFSSTPTDDPRTALENDPTGTAVSPTDMVEPYKSWALTIDADHNGMPSPGDTLTYTVNIENIGNHDVSGVVFSDVPDVHSPLVSGSVTTDSGSVIEGNSPGDNAVTVNLGTIPGSFGSATVTYMVIINNPLPVGVTQLSNQGFVFGPSIAADPTDDPTDQSYDNATVTQLTAEPLIETYKRYELTDDADNNSLVNPGDSLTYFITIVNKGNQNATGMIFSDVVDSNTSLIPGSTITSQGSVTSETLSGLMVDIGTIPGGNYTVTISFKVTVKPGVTEGFYNQGTVTVSGYPDVLTDDPNTHTMHDATYTTIAQGPPELRVTKSAILAVDADNNNVPSPGDTLQYIVAINNNGGSAAYNLTFTDTLDPNTTLVPGSISASLPATISETPFIQVDIGTLEGGSTHSICLVTFEATINSPFSVDTDTVANQGSVSADGIGPIATDDPNTAASPDATVTDVTLIADLVLTKTRTSSHVLSGGTLTYTLTVTNNGPYPAENVIVTETYPAGFSFSSSVPLPDTGSDNQWTIASIPVNASQTIVITGKVTAVRGTLTNTAGVISSTYDPDPANSTASQISRIETPLGIGGQVTGVDKTALLAPWLILIIVLLISHLGLAAYRRRGG